MVPGHPPRRSKNTDKPVTLDLDAKDFASSSESEKRQDEVVSASPAEPDVVPTSDPEAVSEPHAAAANPTPDGDPVGEPQATVTDDVTEREPEQTAERTSTAKLLAAGIAGGLIALLAAGAIQYALVPSANRQNDRTAELSADIEGLKQAVANLAANPGAGGSGELEKRIAALESAGAAGAGGNAAAEQKIAELTGQVDQLRSTIAQSAQQQTETRTELASRLQAAETKLNAPRADEEVAKAVGAAALKAAIDRGGGFKAELDTYAQVAPDDETVAQLKPYAESGVPSRAELIRQVPGVATAIVDAANRPDPNAGWSERLMSSAQSLVKVRPVGAVEGDGVEAVAARIEDKVKNGDLQGAAAEWASLPEPAKQASAAFNQSLEARIRVEDLVGATLSKAVSQTGKEG